MNHLSTRLGFVAFCLLFCFSSISAQDDPHAHHQSVGYVPKAILERPLPIRSGTGTIHEPVTTSSRDAQAFYDQGLAYLHSYVWVEAARSFNQALRLDGKLAMAYVGLSRAYSGLDDQKAARESLERAQSLASGATAREQRRILLRAKQLDAISDIANPAKHLEYKKALDEALSIDINDPELWLLRGNAEEPTAAGRGQRGGLASTAFYERVFGISPDNFAAHHYLVHSYENIGQMEPALKHGEVYARLAFAIPHARHMYGHDLRRVGRIMDAIAEFRKADDLENSYYRTENIPSDYDWHHQHNLDLLSTSYQYVGQMKTAEQLMKQAFDVHSVDEGREFAKKEWPRFLLGKGRRKEALDAANQLIKGKYPMTRATGYLIAGQVLLSMNKVAEAKEQLAAAEKQLKDAPQTATSGATLLGVAKPGGSGTPPAVEPEIEALRAEILLREGKTEEGRAMFKTVQRKLRALLGPDAWSQALFRLESIAQVAREAGDWELAEYTAKQMLEHDPAYGGSHYALALVDEHRGQNSAAEKGFARAEEQWRNADADLPELLHARAKKMASRK
jgi:tetratricopeptide (TPR) repeat protein